LRSPQSRAQCRALGGGDRDQVAGHADGNDACTRFGHEVVTRRPHGGGDIEYQRAARPELGHVDLLGSILCSPHGHLHEARVF